MATVPHIQIYRFEVRTLDERVLCSRRSIKSLFERINFGTMDSYPSFMYLTGARGATCMTTTQTPV